MDSTTLSLDESIDEFAKQPQSCSTPKAKKNDKKVKVALICPTCGKRYVQKFYLDKHIQSKHAQAPSDATCEINLTTPMQVDDSCISLSLLDDDNNNTVVVQDKNTVDAFKVPALPSKRKPPTKAKPTFVCTYCQKGFMREKSYESHVRIHRVQACAAIFPDKDKIMAAVGRLSIASLTKVANAPTASCCPKFKELVGVVIGISASDDWEECVSSLCCKLLGSALSDKVMLPSATMKCLYENLEEILSSSTIANDHMNILGIPEDFSSDLKDQFFLEFMLNFVQEVIAFISETFRKNYPISMALRQPTKTVDQVDRQVIYYIGGALLRSYFRMGYRHHNNKTWLKVCAALKGRVTCDKPVDNQDEDSAWTVKVSRGGLVFITPECQRFLVALTLIVYSCEDSKGSINYEKVIDKVSNSNVSVMWDTMISDSLTPTVSLNLMNDFIQRFCRTCVRGFAKRRLNLLRSRPVVSMPTRHVVASRKK